MKTELSARLVLAFAKALRQGIPQAVQHMPVCMRNLHVKVANGVTRVECSNGAWALLYERPNINETEDGRVLLDGPPLEQVVKGASKLAGVSIAKNGEGPATVENKEARVETKIDQHRPTDVTPQAYGPKDYPSIDDVLALKGVETATVTVDAVKLVTVLQHLLEAEAANTGRRTKAPCWVQLTVPREGSHPMLVETGDDFQGLLRAALMSASVKD